MSIHEAIRSVGGRRFFMTASAGVVHTALVIFHYIPPEIYRDLTIATVAAFIAGATYQNVADIRSARAAPESPGA